MKNAQELKAIYAGPSFKDREGVARFDEGGSYYDAVNFANPTEPQYVTSPAGNQVGSYYQGPIAGGGAASDAANGVPVDPNVAAAANTAANQPIAPPSSVSANLLTPAQLGQSSGSSGSGLLNSIGSSSLLPAIVGILSAAGHFAQSKGAATLPAMPGTPGFTGSSALPALPGANGSNGFGPAGGYNFGNYSGVSTPGLGYAPRTQAPAMPMSSYYTYGQGPEHQFFTPVNPTSGVAPPTSSGTTPPPGQKKGGRVKKFALGGLNTQNPMLGAGAPNGLNPMGGNGTASGFMPQQSAAPQNTPPATGALGSPPAMAHPAVMPNPAPRPVAPIAPLARPAPTPTMPVARPVAPMMANTQPVGPMRPIMRAAGGPADPADPTKTSYANTWGQWTPPAPSAQAQSNVTGAPARGALSDVIPHRAMVGHAAGGPMPQGQGPQTMSRHVRGPGDGTSDSIPARLANGEYVISADVVSGLGNGDNGSGAKKLDAFVHNVRVHKSQNASQGKLPADAHPIPQYMGGQ